MRRWLERFRPVRTTPDDRAAEVLVFRDTTPDSDPSDEHPHAPDTPPSLRWRIAGVGVLLLSIALLFFGLYCVYRLGARLSSFLAMPAWVGGTTALVAFISWLVYSKSMNAYLPWLHAAVRSELRAIAVSRLREGACGACTHPLDNLPSEGDGCTRCPECGAAWRMDLWERDHVPSPSPPEQWTHPDRARKHRLTDARETPCLAWASRPRHVVAHKFRELRAQLWWSTSRFLAYLGVLAFTAAAVCAPLAFAGTPGNTLGVSTAIALGLVALLLVIHHRAHVRNAIQRQFIAEHTARNLCPQCEHPLRTTPAISDGALLCETCAAAWDRPPQVGADS